MEKVWQLLEAQAHPLIIADELEELGDPLSVVEWIRECSERMKTCSYAQRFNVPDCPRCLAYMRQEILLRMPTTP